MIEVDSDQELFSDVSSTIQPIKKPEPPKVYLKRKNLIDRK